MKPAALVLLILIVAGLLWFANSPGSEPDAGIDGATPGLGPRVAADQVPTLESQATVAGSGAAAGKAHTAKEPADPAPTKRTFLVRVVDAQGGAPIEAAEIGDTEGWVLVHTAADGRVSLRGPDVHEYFLTVRKTGYFPQRVIAYDSSEKEVRLRRGVALEGRVLDPVGKPISGVIVRAWHADAAEELWPSPKTDTNGRYAFDAAPQGKPLQIVAMITGGARPSVMFTLEDGRTDVDIQVPHTPTVFGTVTSFDGQPAAGVKLVVLPHKAVAIPSYAIPTPERVLFRARTCVTDSAGGYRFESLPPDDDYQIVALPSETQQERSEPFSLPESGGLDVRRDLRLRAPAGLVLTLQYDDGEFISLEAAVILRSSAGSFHPYEPPVGLQSFWPEFRDMTPGTYLLRVAAEGYPVYEESIELVAGKTLSRTITIPRGHTIEGVVVDNQGHPLSHVGIWWSHAGGGHPATTQTDKEGRFQLHGLKEGVGTLKAHYLARRIGMQLGSTILEDVRAGQRGLRIALSELGQIHARFPDLPPGTELSFQIHSPTYVGTGTTLLGDNGAFEQPVPIANEPFMLVMYRDGFAPLIVDRKAVSAGVDIELGSLRFHPGVTLRGVVEDDLGEPVPGAQIQSAQLGDTGSVRADSEERFELQRLPPRVLCVLIEAEGFPQHMLCLDGTALDAHETFQIGRGHELRGRILLPDGKAAAGVTLSVVLANTSRYGDNDRLIQSIECDAAGRFKGHLQAGRYELSANVPARSVKGSIIVDVAQGAAEVELRLR